MRVLVPAMLLLLTASCTEPNPYLGRCGDGRVDADRGEECDLGEKNGPDAACSAECRLPSCGDGVVQDGEVCDLGDENGPGAPCTPLCEVARCGDGYVLEGVEGCDEGDAGNKPVFDGLGGCSSECQRLPTCGDGVIEAPLEECDDGNSDDGDGCDHLCQKPICGDGVLDEGEACDDGNKSDSDACLSTCEIAKCGDAAVHEGVEECDDGNTDNNDACLTVCLAARCGDGLLHEGVEECDDGNEIDDDGCDNACVRDRLVFITEEASIPELVGDLHGADQECQKRAFDAGHPNPTNFKAWLSNATNSPATRFFRSSGRYVLSTGEVVAMSWDDLVDGELLHGIDRTIDGLLLSKWPVWSNTQVNGERFDDGMHCMNWTDSDPGLSARIGLSGHSDATWTDVGAIATCGDGALLYCFEQM